MAVKLQRPFPQKFWRKLWYSKTIHDTLMPLYRVSRVVGLSPYRHITVNGKDHYVFSKPGTLYSLLFIASYIGRCEAENVLGLFAYASNGHSKMSVAFNRTSSKIANFIDTFQWFTSVIVMTTLILTNCYQQKHYLKAVVQLAAIDEEIENFRMEIDHYRAKKEVLATVSWQVIAFVIMEQINCSLFLAEMQIRATICYVLCIIPLLIGGFVKNQFVVLVVLLRYRFETINTRLKTFTSTFSEPSTVKTIHVLPHNYTLNTISVAKRLHGRLCEVGVLVNRAFSLQMLCIIGYNFISFTAHSYFCVESFIKAYLKREYVDIGLATTFMWTVVKLAVLFHLTYVCTQTKNQIALSGILVHKIRNRFQSGILNEIMSFCQQILHWDFKFTACDFFDIDMTTFYAMITSAITYLIILIQLDVAVNQKKSYISQNLTLKILEH